MPNKVWVLIFRKMSFSKMTRYNISRLLIAFAFFTGGCKPDTPISKGESQTKRKVLQQDLTKISQVKLSPEKALCQGITKSSQSRLASFLQQLPSGYESSYGFRNRDELSQGILGSLYPMFTIASSKRTVDNPNLFLPLRVWRAIVLIRGEARSLVTIRKQKEQWELVEVGAVQLAKELAELDKLSGRDKAETMTALLRVYPLHSDFLVIYPKGKSIRDGAFYPMRSARSFLGLPMKSLSLDSLLVTVNQGFRRIGKR